MRAVVQRVKEARVHVNGTLVGEIGKGVLIYLGVQRSDGEASIEYLAEKILGLRIFEDDQGKMNRSVLETSGELLVVSQFTLYGDCRKGKRPSFLEAAPPERALIFYEKFVGKCRQSGLKVETGSFREMMEVFSVNNGPVTLLVDSEKQF